MTNPSNQTNPLDYPRYVRGIRPALPTSLGDYVENEFEKVQNSMENMAVAADKNTKTQVADLKITVDQNTADITNEQTVRASQDQALSTQIDTVQATADGKNTVYWQSTAPTGGTYIQGDLWIDIGSNNELNVWDPAANSGAGGWTTAADQRIPANAAAITTEQTARIDGDNALSQQITNLTATVNGNTSAITTEQQARADGDSANATSISNLQTTVNGNTSSISTIQTSVNGLQSSYGVQLNTNGYVTGFVQNNDGKSGSFIITADNFAIVDPNAAPGAAGTTPFQVVGGVTTIQNAMIENLKVDKLADGILNANMTANGDMTMGTGKIIFDNGTVQLIEGVGFGSANQFIQWFGPKQTAYSKCTEANATYYLKADGSAYFGGALSAGTLRSAAQTTNTASNAEIDVGPFSSNGHSISAEISYSYSHTYSCDHGSATGNGASATTTCVLEGSTNSGSTWTTLATINATITCDVTTEPSTPDQVRITGGQSSTVTWNPGASTTLMLRSRITSFAAPNGGGTNVLNNVITQNLGVSSTEQ